MAYKPTGTQAMFPVYLPRQRQKGQDRESYETGIAQNENNLNQNLAILYQKVTELEEALAAGG